MDYLLIKHVHMTAAGLSIVFFLVRAFWSIQGSALLQNRLVKTLPHVIDTVLLLAGVTLAAMIGPEQPWILVKIIALLAYIGVGTIAIKRGKTRTARATAALVAVAIFAYIVGVAMTKSALSWWA
ncbi:SirB2 family protein [Parapusillimonas granuli]|uniref:SirB2 family protein n=1 Tax=Parapusillimonas granuli TaxID=380911 RepID=A0A853G1G4_9BURK|nr:SirB2 family protein [Parapusillimonas granuli]MBB5213457.1 putative membrane protein SirB2 [Parapusillimonas granuli]MEB2398550.1 SirB2 family protein [Alcaligenaceae bacterium]NYT48296.1 SirB2 family protein [Parapusillimonas granuli]